MLQLKNKTQIAIYNFDFVQEVEVRSSWDSLTDTAALTLPKKISYINQEGVLTKRITGSAQVSDPKDFPVFLQGDLSKLWGGYGDDLPLIFSGYIRAVAPNHPIKIIFEDNMYFLKNLFIEKKTFKSVSLFDLVDFITTGRPDHIKLNVVNGVELGQIRISGSTAAEVLSHIKKKYGLVSWFRDDTLNVGLAYLSDQAASVKIHKFTASGPDCNVINTDNLEYKTEDQVKIKLKVISIYPDNTKEEEIIGDLSGALRTVYFYDVPKSSLKEMGREMLNKMVYEGYVGYFKTFLLPLVKHGDAVKLSDPEFPDREGVYLVKEVVYNYGTGGGRQKITLDRKI